LARDGRGGRNPADRECEDLADRGLAATGKRNVEADIRSRIASWQFSILVARVLGIDGVF
jgi:hypothetical protein